MLGDAGSLDPPKPPSDLPDIVIEGQHEAAENVLHVPDLESADNIRGRLGRDAAESSPSPQLPKR